MHTLRLIASLINRKCRFVIARKWHDNRKRTFRDVYAFCNVLASSFLFISSRKKVFTQEKVVLLKKDNDFSSYEN